MNTFLCKFCDRKCRPIELHWQCDYHGAVIVRFWECPIVAGEATLINFNLPYRDERFHMDFNILDQTFSILKQDALKNYKTIYTMEGLPSFPPEKAVDKLAKYMVLL